MSDWSAQESKKKTKKEKVINANKEDFSPLNGALTQLSGTASNLV